MLFLKGSSTAGARRAVVVLSALVSVVALLALTATSASAASGDHFTCRASALRVTALPPLLNAEPKVANSAADPCTSDHPAPTASVLLPPLLTTGVVSASTTSTVSSASATGQVANAALFGPLGLTADVATASALYACSAGTPTPQSSSSVVNLRLGGTPITVSGTYSLPLLIGGVATVQLNETIPTGSSVTRRAVDITVLGGVDDGVHIVLAEATAGISGNPCATGSGGGVPVDSTPPVISGTPTAGTTLSCSTGTWTNTPTSFTYQWSRDGTPIAGATNSTYTVRTLDEGLTLTCTVTAYNAAGAGPPATSRGVGVRVPHVRGCPRATGRIGGRTLGLVRLGMTRPQARRVYRLNSTWAKGNQDFFCLTPIGVRVEYASNGMMTRLSRNARQARLGRVVLALTANAYYALDGVRPGATLKAARRALGAGNLFHIGVNWWYFVPHGSWTAVLKLHHGTPQSVIAEVGIADGRLTNSRKAQLAFIRRSR